MYNMPCEVEYMHGQKTFLVPGLLHCDRIRHRPQEHQGGVPRGPHLRGDAQLPLVREQERAGPGAHAGNVDKVLLLFTSSFEY